MDKKTALMLFWAVGLSGCHGVEIVRTGPGVHLRAGAPATGCEQRRWLVVARTRVAPRIGGSSGEAWGLAVYLWGQRRPIPIKHLRLYLDAPKLLARHMKPIQKLLATHDLAQASVGLGFTLSVVGAGILAGILATPIQDPEVLRHGLWFGGGAIVLGSAFAWLYLGIQPRGPRLFDALIRNWLFIAKEDDLRRLMRAVDEANLQTRRRCRKGFFFGLVSKASPSLLVGPP